MRKDWSNWGWVRKKDRGMDEKGWNGRRRKAGGRIMQPR